MLCPIKLTDKLLARLYSLVKVLELYHSHLLCGQCVSCANNIFDLSGSWSVN